VWIDLIASDAISSKIAKDLFRNGLYREAADFHALPSSKNRK